MTSKGKIIFVDVDKDIQTAEEWQLSDYEVIRSESLEQALDHISVSWPGILLCHMKRAGADILPLLKRVAEIDPPLPLVLVAEQVETEVAGTHDVVAKPCPTRTLHNIIDRALERRTLILENRELRSRILSGQNPFQDLLSENWEGRVRKPQNEPTHTPPAEPPILSEQVWAFEKKLIEKELIRQRGNIKKALVNLGLPRQTLYDKMHKYGLKRTDYL